MKMITRKFGELGRWSGLASGRTRFPFLPDRRLFIEAYEGRGGFFTVINMGRRGRVGVFR